MLISDAKEHESSRMPVPVITEQMEKLWARERYDMSQNDREANTHEIHGVKSRYDVLIFENPENHFRALIQFDRELNNPNSTIPASLKASYFRALNLNSSYVSWSDFRLRFLRAEFFDVRKAIVRFCKCLNLLALLFGDKALLRQLFLTDLTKAERRLLKEGDMQLSSSRDSLGRRSLFVLGNVGANYDVQERNRVGIYLLCQVLSEDVTTQQNGLVTIHYMSDDVKVSLGGENTRPSYNLYMSIFESIPLRFSAIHIVFPNNLMSRFLKPLMIYIVGKRGRQVMQFHSGAEIECAYSLSSFGVRPDDIPTTYSGTVKTRQHSRWLKVRTAKDEYFKQQCNEKFGGDYSYFYASDRYTIRPFPHIQCPEINCVLFHKNGVAWEFPGNIKFRAFLDEQLPSNANLRNRSSENPSSAGNLDAPVSPSRNGSLLYRVIRLSLAENFQFLLHDETKHWYTEIKDSDMLKRYIGFAIRSQKRRFSAEQQRRGNSSDNSFTPMDTDSSTAYPMFINMDGRNQSLDGCCN